MEPTPVPAQTAPVPATPVATTPAVAVPAKPSLLIRCWRFIKENWLLILAIIYFFLPVDFIPDFIPFAGWGDDSFLVALELIRRWWVARQKHRRELANSGQ